VIALVLIGVDLSERGDRAVESIGGAEAVRRLIFTALSRPAIATLAASRLTSHSHGPGRVSSKSLRSNSNCRSGEAKAPKLPRCASRKAGPECLSALNRPGPRPSHTPHPGRRRTAKPTFGRSGSARAPALGPPPAPPAGRSDRAGPAAAPMWRGSSGGSKSEAIYPAQRDRRAARRRRCPGPPERAS
jgi:hypothetical protein